MVMAGGSPSSKAYSLKKMAQEQMIRPRKRSSPVRNKTCILVLGMPDQNTTVVSDILGSLGCNLPSGNASGRIAAFNDELLASAGSLPDDFTPFYIDWVRSARGAEFLTRAVSLLEEEFGDTDLFVLSDSRINGLVPLWVEALAQFECAYKTLLVVGNPITLSIHESQNQPLSQLLWLRGMLDSERDTRGTGRFFVSFDKVEGHWADVVKEAQDALGLIWPKSIASAEFDVAALFGKTDGAAYRPQTTGSFSPAWVVDTHAILDRWAHKGETEAEQATLDRIRAEFDMAANAFGRVIRAARNSSGSKPRTFRRAQQGAAPNRLISAAEDAEALKTSLQDERRRNTLLNAEIELQIENREAVETQLVEAQAEIAANRARRKEMARVIANREAKIDRLGRDLADRYQELATLQRQIVRSNPVWLARAGFRKVARAARRPTRKDYVTSSE